MKRLVLGILAHVDAGKTTLSEALLYTAGAIPALGRVDHRDAHLDTHELERARGITIFSKQALFETEQLSVTLLDTPGPVDFSAEMERTLQVLDYAILVISATDGVQAHTETLWRLLRRRQIPTFVFLTKMDLPNPGRAALMAQLRKHLDEGCLDFTEQDEDWLEAIAIREDALLDQYLDTGKVDPRDISGLIRLGKLFPCFFGSALHLDGVTEFLQGLAAYTEAPTYGEDFAARVFKIARDPQGNRLTYVKLTGGTLHVRDPIAYYPLHGEELVEEKVTQLRLYSGEKFQAVSQVLGTIEEEYNKHPEFDRANLIERLCIPDRVIQFRVNWIDDKGNVQTNMGYRIQHNNAIGPYKGGLRFHASVNVSILKFLAFEQTFKNSLTTLPMGGAKGGSDFSPRGKSNAEVMRFCQAFMRELWNYIGPDCDVPAGDIGVGGREVGYMFGQYKALTHQFVGILTGKGQEFGGSLIRPEATGYGNVYFLQNMLATKGIDLKGKKVLVSGAGNVAQYTMEKLLQLGATPMTCSDSDGYIYDPDGIDEKKLAYIMELKNIERGRIKEYVEEYPTAKYVPGAKPWGEKADIATPCATQNEIDGEAAKTLVANGVIAVSEGANMPSTPEAVKVFQDNKILYCPGKASNAGGVAVSGLEMTQNSERLKWSRKEVDEKLHSIMNSIHAECVKYGTEADGYVNYVKGANVAGFLKVAKAMMAQGIV